MLPILYDPTEKMNKLEKRYADYLYLQQLNKEIISYRFHPFKLILASKTTYEIDFFVIYQDRFEIHETKGFMRDDAAVKLKVAASMFPFWNFKLVKWDRKKGWDIKEVQK